MGKRITIAVAEELKRRLLGAGKGTVRKERVKGRLSGDKRKGKGELSTGAEKFSVVEGKSVDKLSTIAEKISAVKLDDVDNLRYRVLVEIILNQGIFGRVSEVVVLLTIINLYFLRGEVVIGQEELGKMTGLTDRTVRDALKNLKIRGFIEINYRRNAKAGESYSYKPVLEKILRVLDKGDGFFGGRYNEVLKILSVPKLSTGAEEFSVVEGENVDKLSTIAEFFSAVNLKDVDNSLKYAYLVGVINSQVVFGGSSSFLVFLALLVLEFTRGVIDVSQAELGAITGISERSIRKILGGLREMGILAVDRRRNAKAGESLVYRILHRKIFPLCCCSFFNYYNVGNFRWKNFPTEKISDDEVIKGEGKFRTIRIDTLIKQYGRDRVYHAMDMLNNQYRDREIAHPYRLIKKVLDDQSFVHNRFYMQFRGKKVGEVVPIYIECSGCGHRGISELRVGNKNRYNETR